MSASKLPGLATLVWLRRFHTVKEIADFYDCTPRAVWKRLARAEALMLASKRRGWAAWEAKCIPFDITQDRLSEVEGRGEAVKE